MVIVKLYGMVCQIECIFNLLDESLKGYFILA